MKLVARVCEAIAVLLVVFIAVFSNYIDNARPNHSTGRYIVHTENHGEPVYISRADTAVLTGAWVALFVVGVACIGLEEALRSKR